MFSFNDALLLIRHLETNSNWILIKISINFIKMEQIFIKKMNLKQPFKLSLSVLVLLLIWIIIHLRTWMSNYFPKKL